jgi:hypothetical protein
MPELPEAERTRQALEHHALGRVTLDPARGRLGPDALEMSLDRFRDLVGRSRAPIRGPCRVVACGGVVGRGQLAR